MKPALFCLLLFGVSAASAANDPLVQLTALYATTEVAGHGPSNLFDSPGESWRLPAGAGNYEGVMLSFMNRPDVAAVELIADAAAAPIRAVRVFVDGARAADGAPGERITIDARPSSLFIRIDSADFYKPVLKSDSGGTRRVVVSAETNGQCAIDELRLFDSKGRRLVVQYPRSVKGRVTASSVLAPESAYAPAQLFDGRRDYGWAEGSAGNGTGEWLSFEFNSPVKIRRFGLMNGYQRSPGHYTANARAKEVYFGAEGAGRSFTLKDTQEIQFMDTGLKAAARQYRLSVTAVYPGSAYKDMVLSELLFEDEAGLFRVDTGWEEERRRAVIRACSGTVIERYLDRTFSEHIVREDESTVSTFLLRSNGSFAVWTESETGEKSSRVLSGGWDIVKSGAQSATIKIFGSAVINTMSADFYARNREESRVVIFNDTVTITDESVRGAKWFGAIAVK